MAVRCSSLRYEGIRDNLLSRGSYVYSKYVAFTWRYVDITCHYVELRGYYVADTIKFFEGLTQRLRGLPVALRMLRGSLLGPRFTWRLRHRKILFPKFVLRCSYEATLRKGVTTALPGR